MKIVCISKDHKYLTLTYGKIYNADQIFTKDKLMGKHLIEDDFGAFGWYNKDLFISLEEFRDNKLKELGL